MNQNDCRLIINTDNNDDDNNDSNDDENNDDNNDDDHNNNDNNKTTDVFEIVTYVLSTIFADMVIEMNT